jgi:hypothetical protein
MAGRNNGTAFERQLETIFAAYLKQGRAKIEKVDPPTKVLGRKVLFMPNPWLDFAGVWTERDGRTLLIEAKTTLKPTLELGGTHGLTKAQWGNAMDWQRAGAMVLLLWEHKGEIRVTTPSMAMADCREQDRKSLRWCDAHKLPQGIGWVTFDPLTWAARLTD